MTREEWHATDHGPVVLVIGSFDVPHYGHFDFLAEAARLGEVVCAIGTDDWQRGYKREPVLNYWQRKATLDRLPWVSLVVPRNEPSTRALVAEFDPDYMPYGNDWELPDYLAINGLDYEYIDRHHITMVRIVRGTISSSLIIERARSTGENRDHHAE